MDCYFTGFSQDRPRHDQTIRLESMLQCCGVPLPQPCPPAPCPPENYHLRPAAGVASGQGRQGETNWGEEPCKETLRSFCFDTTPRRSCPSHVRQERFEQPNVHCFAIPCDGLRFSRHAVADRMNMDCRHPMKESPRTVQVGSQPMQFMRVEDFDPCPQKKGPDCDCFNPDGTWKDKSKSKQKPEHFKVNRNPVNLHVDLNQRSNYDPCPNKKGPDCDCFNPDGSWREKPKSMPKLDPCVTNNRKCEDNCPECPIEIHSRTVYPKCEAMLPGYGGHVPGLNVCKFGKTYGRETREALQKVYSTPLLSRNKRKC